MLIRCGIAVLFLAGLAGCAKHKHVTTRLPPTPTGSEIGIASWYGHPYHGRAAANGEIYDMEKMTAAHRTLPFGTWVRVTNLTNDKSVDLRIIDRGPFIEGRIIDVSHAAARDIDLIGPGIARVRVDVIPPPAGSPLPAQYSVQIGVFQERERAERLRLSMQTQFGSARIVPQPQPDGRPGLWRVLVGVAATPEEAGALAAKVRSQTGEGLVVRFDGASADSGSR